MSHKMMALLLVTSLAWGCGSSTSAREDGDDDTSTPSDVTDSTPSDTIPDTTPPDGPPPDGPPPDGPPPDGPPPDGPPPDGPPPDGPPPDGPPPDGNVGDPCYTGTDCMGVPGSGRTCLTDISGFISFPGGYCSADCTSDGDCGTGGECVDFYGYASYCLKVCTSATDCRVSEGYACDRVPGGPSTTTYCIPPMAGPDGGPVDP